MMDQSPQHGEDASVDRSFKICLMGDAAVGKTCLCQRLAGKPFPGSHVGVTIGAAFATVRVQLEDLAVLLQIWDTAGQEKYRSLVSMYFRGATGILIVYDVSEPDTFESAKQWYANLVQHGMDPSNMVVVLVGNKCDLRYEATGASDCVSTDVAKSWAREKGALFFEASALTGENVASILRGLITGEEVWGLVGDDVDGDGDVEDLIVQRGEDGEDTIVQLGVGHHSIESPRGLLRPASTSPAIRDSSATSSASTSSTSSASTSSTTPSIIHGGGGSSVRNDASSSRYASAVMMGGDGGRTFCYLGSPSLPLVSSHVESVVVHLCAEVHGLHTYRNGTGREVQGVFLLPKSLHQRSVLHSFRAHVGASRVVLGEVHASGDVVEVVREESARSPASMGRHVGSSSTQSTSHAARVPDSPKHVKGRAIRLGAIAPGEQVVLDVRYAWTLQAEQGSPLLRIPVMTHMPNQDASDHRHSQMLGRGLLWWGPDAPLSSPATTTVLLHMPEEISFVESPTHQHDIKMGESKISSCGSIHSLRIDIESSWYRTVELLVHMRGAPEGIVPTLWELIDGEQAEEDHGEVELDPQRLANESSSAAQDECVDGGLDGVVGREDSPSSCGEDGRAVDGPSSPPSSSTNTCKTESRGTNHSSSGHPMEHNVHPPPGMMEEARSHPTKPSTYTCMFVPGLRTPHGDVCAGAEHPQAKSSTQGCIARPTASDAEGKSPIIPPRSDRPDVDEQVSAMAPPPEMGGDGGIAPQEQRPGARGAEEEQRMGTKTRFNAPMVFCIDVGEKMRGMLWRQLKNALHLGICSLPHGTIFNIVGYGRTSSATTGPFSSWKGAESLFPISRGTLGRPLDSSTLSAAQRWISRWMPAPHEPLEEAHGMWEFHDGDGDDARGEGSTHPSSNDREVGDDMDGSPLDDLHRPHRAGSAGSGALELKQARECTDERVSHGEEGLLQHGTLESAQECINDSLANTTTGDVEECVDNDGEVVDDDVVDDSITPSLVSSTSGGRSAGVRDSTAFLRSQMPALPSVRDSALIPNLRAQMLFDTMRARGGPVVARLLEQEEEYGSRRDVRGQSRRESAEIDGLYAAMLPLLEASHQRGECVEPLRVLVMTNSPVFRLSSLLSLLTPGEHCKVPRASVWSIGIGRASYIQRSHVALARCGRGIPAFVQDIDSLPRVIIKQLRRALGYEWSSIECTWTDPSDETASASRRMDRSASSSCDEPAISFSKSDGNAWRVGSTVVRYEGEGATWYKELHVRRISATLPLSRLPSAIGRVFYVHNQITDLLRGANKGSVSTKREIMRLCEQHNISSPLSRYIGVSYRAPTTGGDASTHSSHGDSPRSSVGRRHYFSSSVSCASTSSDASGTSYSSSLTRPEMLRLVEVRKNETSMDDRTSDSSSGIRAKQRQTHGVQSFLSTVNSGAITGGLLGLTSAPKHSSIRLDTGLPMKDRTNTRTSCCGDSSNRTRWELGVRKTHRRPSRQNALDDEQHGAMDGENAEGDRRPNASIPREREHAMGDHEGVGSMGEPKENASNSLPNEEGKAGEGGAGTGETTVMGSGDGAASLDVVATQQTAMDTTGAALHISIPQQHDPPHRTSAPAVRGGVDGSSKHHLSLHVPSVLFDRHRSRGLATGVGKRPLDDLVLLQHSDGHWTWGKEFASAVEANFSSLAAEIPTMRNFPLCYPRIQDSTAMMDARGAEEGHAKGDDDDGGGPRAPISLTHDMWATALAIAYMQVYLCQDDEWELIRHKAMAWMMRHAPGTPPPTMDARVWIALAKISLLMSG